MIAISAHFDGEVIVPDEPLDLPRDQALIVRIEPAEAGGGQEAESVLTWLAEHASESPDLQEDLSQEHDHYLYGLAKKRA